MTGRGWSWWKAQARWRPDDRRPDLRDCTLQGVLMTARRVRATGIRVIRPAHRRAVQPGTKTWTFAATVETSAVVGISVKDAA